MPVYKHGAAPLRRTVPTRVDQESPVFSHTLAHERHVFADLKTLLAKASPARSGDALAGVAAASARVCTIFPTLARMCRWSRSAASARRCESALTL